MKHDIRIKTNTFLLFLTKNKNGNRYLPISLSIYILITDNYIEYWKNVFRGLKAGSVLCFKKYMVPPEMNKSK